MLRKHVIQSHSKYYINVHPQPWHKAHMVFMHSYCSSPMFLTQPSVWPLCVPGTCSWRSLEPSSESNYKCPLPLQSFFRKERIVLISAPFLPSRLTFDSVPSHLHNRRIVTYPLARRPIAQYCSISC